MIKFKEEGRKHVASLFGFIELLGNDKHYLFGFIELLGNDKHYIATLPFPW